MEPLWLKAIKDAIASIANLKKYWKVLCKFVLEVSLLKEAKEARQIENMEKYLAVVGKQLALMKEMGCPEEDIQKLAKELNIPLIQANLEAMLIARKLNPPAANDSTPKKSSD